MKYYIWLYIYLINSGDNLVVRCNFTLFQYNLYVYYTASRLRVSTRSIISKITNKK
jgi:hypothetical protein